MDLCAVRTAQAHLRGLGERGVTANRGRSQRLVLRTATGVASVAAALVITPLAIWRGVGGEAWVVEGIHVHLHIDFEVGIRSLQSCVIHIKSFAIHAEYSAKRVDVDW